MARNTFEVDEELESPFDISHLKRAMKYIKPHTSKMILAFLFSALTSFSSLFGPKIMEWVLDDAVPNKDYNMLVRLGIIYIFLVIIGIVFVTIRARMMAHVSQSIIYDIRKDLFAHLQKLPFTYYDNRPDGKILVRVINYVNSVSDMLSNGIINIILEIITIIFIVIFMFQTNVILTLVILAGLPIFIFIIALLKPKQRKAWQDMSNKNSNYNAYLAESIDGVRVSQSFARQEKNISVLTRLITAAKKAWMKAIYLSHSVWLSAEILTQAVTVMMYVAGVYWLGDSMVSFGVIMAMGAYVGRFWQPIVNLANIYNDFINNIAYLERIFETMDEPITVDDAPDATELKDVKGKVEFKDVTFGYEEGSTILEDISFTVEAGQSVALVGETGAGKSTIINLLARFYNINSGKIIIDNNYDISKVTLSSLRSNMGVMLQDSFIFSGTIIDNIRYGRLDATDEEVVAAAKAVHADEFISKMEKGYNTEVNERGSRLSQGEKQLISFARTLLADPKILILDEATSSIDTQTEKLVQEGIETLLAGRTSFIIAHRLSTIKNTDFIMYIANKQIMEKGSHEELLAQKGRYYSLYTAQAPEGASLNSLE